MNKTVQDAMDWKAWKWKAGAFLRILSLLEDKESKERFIAEEFCGLYMTGYIHGKEGITFKE